MQNFLLFFVLFHSYLLIFLETMRACTSDGRTSCTYAAAAVSQVKFSKCWRPEQRSLPLRSYYRVGIQGY